MKHIKYFQALIRQQYMSNTFSKSARLLLSFEAEFLAIVRAVAMAVAMKDEILISNLPSSLVSGFGPCLPVYMP